jgi:hypothetical protein
MKGGEGSPEWLRLFALMSAEFALAERCPEPAGLPERSERVREIKDLEIRLDAVKTLENITHVVRYTENIEVESEPEYYQIIYDRKKRIVSVQPYSNVVAGAQAYDETELTAEKSHSEITSVLVEADGIEVLKAAYPNYFGDVQKFCLQLKAISQGDQALEYEMLLPNVETPKNKPYEKPDMSWLRRSRFNKPRGG